MDVQQPDERVLTWESSPDTFWVFSFSGADADTSPELEAFRLAGTSLEEVFAWVRELGLDDVAIGAEISSPEVGVAWLVRSPHL